MNTNSVNPLSSCILETNPLIQKGKETLYQWHKRVHQRLTPLISKICAFISEIFERIRASGYHAQKRIMDILWPYKSTTGAEGEHPVRSLFAEILHQGCQRAENSVKETKKETGLSIKTSVVIQGPAMAAYLATSYGAMPMYFAYTMQKGDSFITNVFTATITQNLAKDVFSRALNNEFLEKYALQSKLDVIDRYLYQSSIVIVAKTLNVISQGALNRPLHFAIAFVAVCPPLQNKVMKLSLIKNISKNVHEWTAISRNYVKRSLQPLMRKLVILQIEKIIPKVDQSCKRYGTNTYAQIEREVGKEWANRISKLGFLVGVYFKEPMEGIVQEKINHISDCMADGVINLAIQKGCQTVEFYFFHRALTITLLTHPLLGAASLVVRGGAQQTIGELSLRIAGAATYLFTSSTFLPLAIIYVPQFIGFVMKMRGKLLKKSGVHSDPAIEVFKRLFKHTDLFHSSANTKIQLKFLPQTIQAPKTSPFQKTGQMNQSLGFFPRFQLKNPKIDSCNSFSSSRIQAQFSGIGLIRTGMIVPILQRMTYRPLYRPELLPNQRLKTMLHFRSNKAFGITSAYPFFRQRTFKESPINLKAFSPLLRHTSGFYQAGARQKFMK